MKRFTVVGSGISLFGVLLLFGCSDDPNGPTGDSPDLAIIGTDPAPQAPGIFLGSNINTTQCFNGSQLDTDIDGMSDLCENALAKGFAPQLATSSTDRTGREPHWVARPLNGGKARVDYLLSYYFDDGTPGCNLGPILCGGHYGDSEEVVLDLYYNPGTQHWILDQAMYSVHGIYLTYARLFLTYPLTLNYPGKPGGYPRAYVSLKKHANYGSDLECDAGAAGTDDCRADTFQRVNATKIRNLGSRANHSATQDCLASTNPLYSGNGVTECYWTNRPFGGWQGRTPEASAYSPKLSALGF